MKPRNIKQLTNLLKVCLFVFLSSACKKGIDATSEGSFSEGKTETALLNSDIGLWSLTENGKNVAFANNKWFLSSGPITIGLYDNKNNKEVFSKAFNIKQNSDSLILFQPDPNKAPQLFPFTLAGKSKVLIKSFPSPKDWKLVQNNEEIPAFGYQNYAIPLNKSTLSLINRATDAEVFKGDFTIKAPADTLLFFQPNTNGNPIIMSQLLKTEPKPAEPYFKIKYMNFAQEITGNAPIDLVFEVMNGTQVIKRDTIFNVTQSLPDKYTSIEMQKIGTGTNYYRIYNIIPIDSKTKKPILTGATSLLQLSPNPKSVMVYYIATLNIVNQPPRMFNRNLLIY